MISVNRYIDTETEKPVGVEGRLRLYFFHSFTYVPRIVQPGSNHGDKSFPGVKGEGHYSLSILLLGVRRLNEHKKVELNAAIINSCFCLTITINSGD